MSAAPQTLPAEFPAPTPEPLADVCQRVEEAMPFDPNQGLPLVILRTTDRDRLLTVTRAAEQWAHARTVPEMSAEDFWVVARRQMDAIRSLEAAVRGEEP